MNSEILWKKFDWMSCVGVLSLPGSCRWFSFHDDDDLMIGGGCDVSQVILG
jgi:hypothetical protein